MVASTIIEGDSHPRRDDSIRSQLEREYEERLVQSIQTYFHDENVEIFRSLHSRARPCADSLQYIHPLME